VNDAMDSEDEPLIAVKSKLEETKTDKADESSDEKKKTKKAKTPRKKAEPKPVKEKSKNKNKNKNILYSSIYYI
jgi:hypothetical protein